MNAPEYFVTNEWTSEKIQQEVISGSQVLMFPLQKLFELYFPDPKLRPLSLLTHLKKDKKNNQNSHEINNTNCSIYIRIGTKKGYDRVFNRSKELYKKPLYDNICLKSMVSVTKELTITTTEMFIQFFNTMFTRDESEPLKKCYESNDVITIAIFARSSYTTKQTHILKYNDQLIGVCSFVFDTLDSVFINWIGVSDEKVIALEENGIVNSLRHDYSLGSFMIAISQIFKSVISNKWNIVVCQVHNQEKKGPLGFYKKNNFITLHRTNEIVYQQNLHRMQHMYKDDDELVWMCLFYPSHMLQMFQIIDSEDDISFSEIITLCKNVFLRQQTEGPIFQKTVPVYLNRLVGDTNVNLLEEPYIFKLNQLINDDLDTIDLYKSAESDQPLELLGGEHVYQELFKQQIPTQRLFIDKCSTKGNNKDCFFKTISQLVFGNIWYDEVIRLFFYNFYKLLSRLHKQHSFFIGNNEWLATFLSDIIDRNDNNDNDNQLVNIDDISWPNSLLLQHSNNYLSPQFDGRIDDLKLICSVLGINFVLLKIHSTDYLPPPGIDRQWKLELKSFNYNDYIDLSTYQTVPLIDSNSLNEHQFWIAQVGINHYHIVTLRSDMPWGDGVSHILGGMMIDVNEEVSASTIILSPSPKENELLNLTEYIIRPAGRNPKSIFKEINVYHAKRDDKYFYKQSGTSFLGEQRRIGNLFEYKDYQDAMVPEKYIMPIARCTDPLQILYHNNIWPIRGQCTFDDLIRLRQATWIGESSTKVFIEWMNTISDKYIFIDAASYNNSMMKYILLLDLFNKFKLYDNRDKTIMICLLITDHFIVVEIHWATADIYAGNTVLVKLACSLLSDIEVLKQQVRDKFLDVFLTTLLERTGHEYMYILAEQVSEQDLSSSNKNDCGIFALRRMYSHVFFGKLEKTNKVEMELLNTKLFRLFILWKTMEFQLIKISSYIMLQTVELDTDVDNDVTSTVNTNFELDNSFNIDSRSVADGNLYISNVNNTRTEGDLLNLETQQFHDIPTEPISPRNVFNPNYKFDEQSLLKKLVDKSDPSTEMSKLNQKQIPNITYPGILNNITYPIPTLFNNELSITERNQSATNIITQVDVMNNDSDIIDDDIKKIAGFTNTNTTNMNIKKVELLKITQDVKGLHTSSPTNMNVDDGEYESSDKEMSFVSSKKRMLQGKTPRGKVLKNKIATVTQVDIKKKATKDKILKNGPAAKSLAVWGTKPKNANKKQKPNHRNALPLKNIKQPPNAIDNDEYIITDMENPLQIRNKLICGFRPTSDFSSKKGLDLIKDLYEHNPYRFIDKKYDADPDLRKTKLQDRRNPDNYITDLYLSHQQDADQAKNILHSYYDEIILEEKIKKQKYYDTFQTLLNLEANQPSHSKKWEHAKKVLEESSAHLIMLEWELKQQRIFLPFDSVFGIKVNVTKYKNKIYNEFLVAVSNPLGEGYVEKLVNEEWVYENFEKEFVQKLLEYEHQRGFIYFDEDKQEIKEISNDHKLNDQLKKLKIQPIYKYKPILGDDKILIVKHEVIFNRYSKFGKITSEKWYILTQKQSLNKNITDLNSIPDNPLAIDYTGERLHNSYYHPVEKRFLIDTIGDLVGLIRQASIGSAVREIPNGGKLSYAPVFNYDEKDPRILFTNFKNQRYLDEKDYRTNGKRCLLASEVGDLSVPQIYYYDMNIFKQSFYINVCNEEISGICFNKKANRWYGLKKTVGPNGNPLTAHIALEDHWVDANFSRKLIQLAKSKADLEDRKYVKVPIGFAQPLRSPPEIHMNPIIKYPQNGEDTCCFSSLCSAMHYLGDARDKLYYYTIAEMINQYKKEFYDSNNFDHKYQNVIGKINHRIMILGVKQFNTCFEPRKIKGPSNFDLLQSAVNNMDAIYHVVIKGIDASENHCICITNNWIFDGNYTHALPLNQNGLNSAIHTTYVCITGGYMFLPRNT